jgi:hypothetical protein
MPSEKEIEEAIRIERLQRDKHNSARSNYEALAEAYLSMKSERDAYKMDLGLAHIAIDHRNELLESCEQAFIEAQAERDKYKAIVEADTRAFGKVEGWLVCEPICINEDFIQAVPDMLDIVQSALALREKES